jgi:cysteine desulfurase/selenocysteine lyase
MEHHSNMLPWQQACKDAGAELHVIRLLPDGTLDMDHFRSLLKANVALVSLTHVSNALGTINPVKEIIEMAHAVGAHVLLDGAQAVQHIPINVQELDCDFYVFSGHKLYAPTGIGCLYGKKELLNSLPPYQYGGSMIKSVSLEQTVFGDIPNKFEAGTPNIEGALALATAIDYVRTVGIERIAQHEAQLTTRIREGLQKRDGIQLIGTAPNSCGAVSFITDNAHPSDIATLLDMQGIAVRAGHHCCEPLMKYYNIPGTVRASVAMYNTSEDVEVFLRGVDKALSML